MSMNSQEVTLFKAATDKWILRLWQRVYNKSTYWELSCNERNEHDDFPVIHSDNTISYEQPHKVPDHVKAWIEPIIRLESILINP